MEELRRKIQRNEQRLKQNEIPVLVPKEQVRWQPTQTSFSTEHELLNLVRRAAA